MQENNNRHEVQEGEILGIPIIRDSDQSSYGYYDLYRHLKMILTTAHTHTIGDDGIIIRLQDEAETVFYLAPPLGDHVIIREHDIVAGVGTQDIMEQLGLLYDDVCVLRFTVGDLKYIGRKIDISNDWWVELEHHAETIIESKNNGDAPIRVGEGIFGLSTHDIAARAGIAHTQEDFDRLYRDHGFSYRYIYEARSSIHAYNDLLAQAFTYALTDYVGDQSVDLKQSAIRAVMNRMRFMFGTFEPGLFFDDSDVVELTEEDIRNNLPPFSQRDVDMYHGKHLQSKDNDQYQELDRDTILAALTESTVLERMSDIKNLSNVAHVLEVVLNNMWRDFVEKKLDKIRYEFEDDDRGNVTSPMFNNSQYVVDNYQQLWLLGYLI